MSRILYHSTMGHLCIWHFAGVCASHLLHGVYTSFGLIVECEDFCFFLSASFVHLDLEAFIRGGMSGLFYHTVPTIVRSFSRRCWSRGTQVKKLSMVMLRPVFLNSLLNCRDNVFSQILLNFFPWLSPRVTYSIYCIGGSCITNPEYLQAMTWRACLALTVKTCTSPWMAQACDCLQWDNHLGWIAVCSWPGPGPICSGRLPCGLFPVERLLPWKRNTQRISSNCPTAMVALYMGLYKGLPNMLLCKIIFRGDTFDIVCVVHKIYIAVSHSWSKSNIPMKFNRKWMGVIFDPLMHLRVKKTQFESKDTF